MSLKPLIDSLNEHYKAITTYDESDWYFFLNVAEYIQSIKENSVLLDIITQLKNKNPDQTSLEKYKAQALQELKKIKTTLVHRIENEVNCSENLRDIITQLENYTGTDPYELFITLSDTISTLEKNNHKDLIKDLYTIGFETPQVRFYTLSKAYDLFKNEKERIDNLIKTEREMGFGIVWNELEIIYFLILEKENYFRQITKKPNILANEARFLELTAEMEKIKNGSSGKVFQKNKYKQYLIRVHNRLIKEINKKENFALEQMRTDYTDSGFDHNLIRNQKTPTTEQASEIDKDPGKDTPKIKIAIERKPIINTVAGTKWSDVNIKWINGNDVEITLNNNSAFKEIKDFKELGFYDEKRKCPNILWKILLNASRYGGKMSWGELGGISESERIKKIDAFQKQISLLRNKMRDVFGNLKGDKNAPFIPYSRDKEYVITLNLIAKNDNLKKEKESWEDFLSEAELNNYKQLEKNDYIKNPNQLPLTDADY